MDDVVYDFLKDSKEKKNIGISAFRKKSSVRGSKGCTLPSDNLSKKEIEKMSGECINYNLDKPTTWIAFKKWPEDIQIKYLTGLKEKYNVSRKRVAEMLGVSMQPFGELTKKLGFYFGRTGLDRTNVPKWNAFLGITNDSLEIQQVSSISDDSVNKTIEAVQRWYSGSVPEQRKSTTEINEEERGYYGVLGQKYGVQRYQNSQTDSDKNKNFLMTANFNFSTKKWEDIFAFLATIDISSGARVRVNIDKAEHYRSYLDAEEGGSF